MRLAGKEYSTSALEFISRYENVKGHIWQSKEEVKAYKNPTGHSVIVITPSGDTQHGDENCMFVVSTTNSQERYPMDADAFNETYVIKTEKETS